MRKMLPKPHGQGIEAMARVRSGWAWIFGLTVVLAHASVMASEPTQALHPGADISDCRSALRPGPTRCDDAAQAAPETTGLVRRAPDAGPSPLGSAGAMDAQIDAALASYGKPPREAIRALLDPSDANIRALARKQEETLAIASYVAARMTQMQQEGIDAGGSSPAQAPPDLPALLQMRVTLLQRPADPQAQPAYDALLALARDVPGLRAQVALVGSFSAQELRGLIAQVPAPLSAFSIGAEQCAAEALPYLEIEDLRYGQHRPLDARDTTAASLRVAVASLRSDSARAARASTPARAAGAD